MIMRRKEGMGLSGFTLIELLVVVAIIGILSSVVLASLNTARNKGADASIRANLSGTRAEAEIYYDTNGNYQATSGSGGVCDSTAGAANSIFDSVTAAATANSASVIPTRDAIGSATVAACNDTATAWAAQAPLKTGGFFCVDSSGAALYNASNMLGATTDTTC
jgi:prepilin-type N-terminal cleavage/methylation domain-containing protein